MAKQEDRDRAMAEQDDRDAVPGDGRDETGNQRLDRNWNSLLQELRILQTGTQLLTGFLLTVAFQQSFSGLAAWQKTLYLIVVSLAVASTACTLMPVALHRALFRRGAMDELVHWGGRMLRMGLTTTGLAIAGSLALIFSRVVGVGGSLAAGAVTVVVVAALWLALPLSLRRRVGPPAPDRRGPR